MQINKEVTCTENKRFDVKECQRRIILICGMHRSGTSALAHTVHLQGAALPKHLMPAQKDNSQGFWESMPIVQFNNKLLEEAGRTWDDPRAIEPAWWRQPGKRLARIAQASNLLRAEYPEGELLVLKDPRLSRLLPIWFDACKEVALSPSILLCCRHPMEVAASLSVRNGIDIQQAQLLWLSYLLEAEIATRNYPRAIVHYDQLLSDWRNTLLQTYDAIALDSLTLTGEIADQIDTVLLPSQRHHQISVEKFLCESRMSPLIKEAYIAFLTQPMPSNDVFDRLYNRLIDAWLTITAASISLQKQKKIDIPKAEKMPKKTKQTPTSLPEQITQRHIILHYHLFKNAGTSLDHILKQNFKTGWYEHEGPGAGWRVDAVTEYLQQHPEIVILSSHTALMPIPVLPNTTIYPIIFIRHPIDRIRSIYEFERKQNADTEGARVAKQTDLAGYIKWRLNRKGDRSIRNFQTYRLAFAVPEIEEGSKLSEEERALKALKVLPFVGVVEEFDSSLIRLQEWLKPAFPDVEFKPARVNVTQKEEVTLDKRLDVLKLEIGAELYGEIKKLNDTDFKIYKASLNLLLASKIYM